MSAQQLSFPTERPTGAEFRKRVSHRLAQWHWKELDKKRPDKPDKMVERALWEAAKEVKRA